MKRPLACVLALLAVVHVARPHTQARATLPADPAVRLVLLIVIDQFRYDYLTRFGDEYTGGLKRVLLQGAVFTNAHLDHYPSVTAVGHATMMTGATPAVSGIIGNDWYDRATGGSVASVFDPATRLVGAPGGAGASPARLLVGTVGDELKAASRATGSRAPKVIGLSLKDRAAILPAGRSADLALWYDQVTGQFVSSTFYVQQLPAWASGFNARNPVDGYAGKTWTYLDPNAGPGHPLPAERGAKLYDAFTDTPFANELLGALAEAALAGERLGQRGVTDVLTVSFSANDLVGHLYGPDSQEVRDISRRTDRVIETLLARVDALVGLGRTLVVVTADHGVAPIPEVQAARRAPGGRVAGADLFGPIQAALQAKYGEGKWLLATAGSSPYLNHALIADKGLELAEVRRVAARAAATVPRVTRVYTRDQILEGQVQPDLIGRRVLRSYNAQRSGDLEIILEPYWMRSSSGTTHGTPYSYDTHIPLMFMGPGIRPGRYDAPTALNDLAPTLATLLSVETPAGADGRALWEIFDARTAAVLRTTPY